MADRSASSLSGVNDGESCKKPIAHDSTSRSKIARTPSRGTEYRFSVRSWTPYAKIVPCASRYRRVKFFVEDQCWVGKIDSICFQSDAMSMSFFLGLALMPLRRPITRIFYAKNNNIAMMMPRFPLVKCATMCFCLTCVLAVDKRRHNPILELD